MRINWLVPSTSPPTVSPSDADVIRAALARADVIVWRPPAGPAAPGLDGTDIRRWTGNNWIDLNSADATLFTFTEGADGDWIRSAATLHAGVIVVPATWHSVWQAAGRHRGIVVRRADVARKVTRLHSCPVARIDATDPEAYAGQLLDAVGRMMGIAATVPGRIGSKVARVLTDSRINPSAQALIARRVSHELSRWARARSR
jgi:hypothetical protein